MTVSIKWRGPRNGACGTGAKPIAQWVDGCHCDGTSSACFGSPLLLFAASVIAPDTFAPSEAEKLLTVRANDSGTTIWPGPVVEYLLGRIHEAGLRRKCVGLRAIDILSRKWLVDFYVGVSARAAGDNSRFMELMRRTATPSPRFRGHRRLAFDLSSKIRHAEFFLARHALAEAGEEPGSPTPVKDVWNLMVAYCQVFIARRRKAARKTPPVQKSAEKPQEHVGGAGEAYTHLLIAASKTFRPTPRAVSHFLEQVIETGSVGLDREIIFRKVLKGEPGFSLGTPNPFTGRTEHKRLSTRTMRHSERLTDTSQIVGLAETEQEYDVSVVSHARPGNPPLDVGRLRQAAIGDDGRDRIIWKSVAGSAIPWLGYIPSRRRRMPTTARFVVRRRLH